MEISRMTDKEIGMVAEIERECFSQPWSEQVLQYELQNPAAIFYVAHENQTLYGYVGMHRVLDEGYLANVAVTAAARRKGVATQLLEAVIGYAREEKLGFLTLEVRESNLPARKFYEKLGFGEVGRRKRFYANPTEDAVLMTLFLSKEAL